MTFSSTVRRMGFIHRLMGRRGKLLSRSYGILFMFPTAHRGGATENGFQRVVTKRLMKRSTGRRWCYLGVVWWLESWREEGWK